MPYRFPKKSQALRSGCAECARLGRCSRYFHTGYGSFINRRAADLWNVRRARYRQVKPVL